MTNKAVTDTDKPATSTGRDRDLWALPALLRLTRDDPGAIARMVDERWPGGIEECWAEIDREETEKKAEREAKLEAAGEPAHVYRTKEEIEESERRNRAAWAAWWAEHEIAVRAEWAALVDKHAPDDGTVGAWIFLAGFMRGTGSTAREAFLDAARDSFDSWLDGADVSDDRNPWAWAELDTGIPMRFEIPAGTDARNAASWLIDPGLTYGAGAVDLFHRLLDPTAAPSSDLVH